MATELLEHILADENLQEASYKVMSNKGAAGVDHMPVSRLPEYISQHKAEVCEAIRHRRYRPLPVRRVQIPKDDGSKRNLGVPAVRDRWIEQATCQILTPIFEKEFSEHSYGFRPGRKAEQAVLQALEYMNDGFDWIVDLDLSKFFDNVDQDILMILVHKVIKDPDTESLIRRFLQGGVLVDGTFEETTRGTAQGSPISPLLANIYLNEFDKELEARGLRFTRYADDCIICVRSEAAANRVMHSVTNWLGKHLRVKVNATKTKVARPDQCKYLGYTFYWKNGKWRPKPHIKSIQKLKSNLEPLLRRNWGVSLEFRIEKINQVTRGWLNYFMLGEDMSYTLRRLDGKIRIHLRIALWKQWKTARNRANHLYFLKPRHLRNNRKALRTESWKLANSRRGYYRIGKILSAWIPSRLLEEQGLISLEKYYRERSATQLQMSVC